MRLIEELREGEMVSEIYLCKTKQVAKTKAGKSYYSLVLQDKSGTLDGKVWELSNGIEHFDAMDYIKIEGQVTSFQGSNQLNIKRIRKASEGEYDPANYMPCTGKNVEEMYQELVGYISLVKDVYLKQLLEGYFVKDAAFIKAFKNHSAAKSVHHGFIGGLLEHTLGVTRLCKAYTDIYPILNGSLLITAAMFHDIGKLKEISTFPQNDYTDSGQLLGHIVMGTMMLEEKIKEIPNFPEKLKNELLHCIVSHHGELEFGSPKKPSLIEAVALNFADNTDAKIQTFTEVLQGEHSEDWLGYNRFFESNLRKTSKENIK